MREINVEEIKSQVRDLCIDANLKLSPEMEGVISAAKDTEKNPLAVSILEQLQENMEIAKNDGIPICQDTGMAVFFVELGQEVHIVGGDLTEAINECRTSSSITWLL